MTACDKRMIRTCDAAHVIHIVIDGLHFGRPLEVSLVGIIGRSHVGGYFWASLEGC